jgi:hypothetical protein
MAIRDPHRSAERLVEEGRVPSEAALHKVLMRHPELVPATDLGFGRVVTVGFEASLTSGRADLVLLDDEGRVCIVEVKKEGNPDTRKVVAQLLDYAAALWGLTVDEFERRTLRRKLGDEDPRTLDELIMEELVPDADNPEDAAEGVVEALGETLRAGDFTLVLAAPTVPPDVQRVIEYLNARGHSVFGLEVSYFSGDVEAFVPRIVVRPNLGGRIAGGNPPKRRWDEDSFLREIEREHGDGEAYAARELIEWARDRQLRLWWGTGRIEGSFGPVLEHAGQRHYPFTVVTARGKVEIPFDYMTRRRPFDDLQLRRELLRQLNDIDAVSIPEDAISRKAGIPLSLFAADPNALEAFTGVLDWYCETVRSEAQDHAEG